MGTIKDGNIKDLNDPDSWVYYDMVFHLEPDILECEVKWT